MPGDLGALRAMRDTLFHCSLPGEASAVSDGLRRVMAAPIWRGLSADFAASAELVLAEALNNVAEHAYADYPGEIELSVERFGAMVAVRIADRGKSMPEGLLPRGDAPEPLDLPEGSFGWFLIRHLSHDLRYRRHDGWNLFTFRMEDQAA